MESYEELLSLCCGAGGIKGYFGCTFSGYKIPYLEKGGGGKGVLLIGGIHGREFITSYLVLKLFEAYKGNCRLACIPLLNIDGTLLSRRGADYLDCAPVAANADTEAVKRGLLKINGGSKDFSMWKANARGVDINVNFPACWGKGKSNVFAPAPESYVGFAPASENETVAVMRMLNGGRFGAVIAYHSKGEEVYYGFGSNENDREFAERTGRFLNYTVKTTAGSCGGIKDYAVLNGLGKALTIEVGSDALRHPIGVAVLEELFERHNGSIELFQEEAGKKEKK